MKWDNINKKHPDIGSTNQLLSVVLQPCTLKHARSNDSSTSNVNLIRSCILFFSVQEPLIIMPCATVITSRPRHR